MLRRLVGRRRARPRLQPQRWPLLPPVAEFTPGLQVQQLWMTRIQQVVYDTYAGAPCCKFPEDLRVYEHLLWLSRPTVVIEIGAFGGGSALWFRDRLRGLASYGRVSDPFVVSIELHADETRRHLETSDPEWTSSIHLIEGDVTDPSLAAQVRALLPEQAAALVVEDSAHTYQTTRAALAHFSEFVQPGGFFVVEDTCVDYENLRLRDDWPRGVVPAVRDWLESTEGAAFRVRRDLELYGLTTNPGGYLERIR